MSLAWMGSTLLPLFVLFSDARHGRRLGRAVGADRDRVLHARSAPCSRASISPSLVDLVERIRTGAFDYVLLKPVDAQVDDVGVAPGAVEGARSARRDRARRSTRSPARRRAGAGRRRARARAVRRRRRRDVRAVDRDVCGRVVLGRAARQPHVPARRGVRHRALAGPGVPRRVAVRVHVRHAARADDDVPRDGAARPARRARPRSRRVGGALAMLVLSRAAVARGDSQLHERVAAERLQRLEERGQVGDLLVVELRRLGHAVDRAAVAQQRFERRGAAVVDSTARSPRGRSGSACRSRAACCR